MIKKNNNKTKKKPTKVNLISKVHEELDRLVKLINKK